MNPPRFTIEELQAIEDDARDGLLRDGDSRWVPVVCDLASALRAEIESRISGPKH